MNVCILQEADETLNFEEQILQAAKLITAATGMLVKAATAAQRELVESGIVSKNILNTPSSRIYIFSFRTHKFLKILIII